MNSYKLDDYYLIKKCYKNLHWLNDDGSFSFTNNQEPLYRRLLPGSFNRALETVDHTFIIKTIISYMKNKINYNNQKNTYIEYGVRDASNLNQIIPIVDNTYGIDIINSKLHHNSCNFFTGSTDDFSLNHLPNIKFHFAFIDADHKFESCIKDFDNIFKYIQPGGFIFLHDTYPCNLQLLNPEFCNDCYKTPIMIKEKYPNIEILTIPLNPGLTIIRKNI